MYSFISFVDMKNEIMLSANSPEKRPAEKKLTSSAAHISDGSVLKTENTALNTFETICEGLVLYGRKKVMMHAKKTPKADETKAIRKVSKTRSITETIYEKSSVNILLTRSSISGSPRKKELKETCDPKPDATRMTKKAIANKIFFFLFLDK